DRSAGDQVRRAVEAAAELARGDRREHPDREPGREPPGDLRGAEDRGVARLIDEVAADPAARARADPAGIEIGRAAEEALGPAGEDLVAFDEERPLLLEHRLERGEVHLGGIRLDLAEVRVDGGVEGEVAAEADLQ